MAGHASEQRHMGHTIDILRGADIAMRAVVALVAAFVAAVVAAFVAKGTPGRLTAGVTRRVTRGDMGGPWVVDVMTAGKNAAAMLAKRVKRAGRGDHTSCCRNSGAYSPAAT